jgi:hypothetical protein
MNLRSAKYVNKPREAHVKEPNKKHGKDHAEEISRSRGRDQGKEAHQPTGTTPDILAVEDEMSRREVINQPFISNALESILEYWMGGLLHSYIAWGFTGLH